MARRKRNQVELPVVDRLEEMSDALSDMAKELSSLVKDLRSSQDLNTKPTEEDY